MKKKILIVDDEEDIRNTVKEILKSEGYLVETAVNGDDCLEKVNGGLKPDLILMDIMMPGIPVRELVPKLKGLRISFLSVVRATEAEKERLLESDNVIGFIQKPFDVKNLVKRVGELLED